MLIDPSAYAGLGVLLTIIGQQGWKLLGFGVRKSNLSQNGTYVMNGGVTVEKLRELLEESREATVNQLMGAIDTTARRQVDSLERIEQGNTQIRDASIRTAVATESMHSTLIQILTHRS